MATSTKGTAASKKQLDLTMLTESDQEAIVQLAIAIADGTVSLDGGWNHHLDRPVKIQNADNLPEPCRTWLGHETAGNSKEKSKEPKSNSKRLGPTTQRIWLKASALNKISSDGDAITLFLLVFFRGEDPFFTVAWYAPTIANKVTQTPNDTAIGNEICAMLPTAIWTRWGTGAAQPPQQANLPLK